MLSQVLLLEGPCTYFCIPNVCDLKLWLARAEARVSPFTFVFFSRQFDSVCWFSFSFCSTVSVWTEAKPQGRCCFFDELLWKDCNITGMSTSEASQDFSTSLKAPCPYDGAPALWCLHCLGHCECILELLSAAMGKTFSSPWSLKSVLMGCKSAGGGCICT